MNRSTGSRLSNPSDTSGLPRKGPPVSVQLPTAITARGSGAVRTTGGVSGVEGSAASAGAVAARGTASASAAEFRFNNKAGLQKIFRAHEVAHQWWGVEVGYETYRDQWISEALANYAAVLFAIAESPLEEGLIWTGSNDGVVSVTPDGGKTWKNVTPKKLPKGGRVESIEPSQHDVATAYIAVDRHLLGDDRPYFAQVQIGRASCRERV